ncbi:8-oxo-dGTP diphosphatase [Geosmithia morbida]|uniref:8-oxo-dGTP diphosphatase n=1 Tax=Geosmithia morbida TaxID=1094350 RepID=A0A9P5D2B6_9HYPO|nr:8-oxo-dGTP diphosphatase [Geosmithia morbida]KAF4124863.1 8-oxo-dGTP diphosphatase [Geosmithia morbida]
MPEGITRLDGVAAIIINKDGKVLVGKRKGSHGAGSWALPGGHVDPGESYYQTAEREVLEETGLEVTAVRQVARTEDDFVDRGKYYNTYFILCETKDKDRVPLAKTMEPNKCEGWVWMSWSDLQILKGASEPDEKVFRPLHKLLASSPDLEGLKRGR